jgi:hypothetical protein
VRIACALERFFLAHGQYPEDLAALTPQYIPKVPPDIMSGEPFKYQLRGGDGYILYSVGRNLVDDGGRIVFQEARRKAELNLAEGDWVWVISDSLTDAEQDLAH